MPKKSPVPPKIGPGRTVGVAVLGLLLAFSAGCGGGAAQTGSSSPTTSESHVSKSGASTVRAVKTQYGTILVNAAGMTLYRYTADHNNKSNCTWAGCTALWPPLTTTGKPTAGAGVSAGQLGVITGAGGQKQVTYEGWPLYTYSVDTKPGDIRGQGIRDAHGTWYVVYAQATKNPTPPR